MKKDKGGSFSWTKMDLKERKNNTIVMTVDEIWVNAEKSASLTFDDSPQVCLTVNIRYVKKYNAKPTFLCN